MHLEESVSKTFIVCHFLDAHIVTTAYLESIQDVAPPSNGAAPPNTLGRERSGDK